MERFYFNIFNDDITIDNEGIECLDLDAARKRAMIESRVLACHAITQYGTLNLRHRIDIMDETGAICASVSFADAIKIIP